MLFLSLCSSCAGFCAALFFWGGGVHVVEYGKNKKWKRGRIIRIRRRQIKIRNTRRRGRQGHRRKKKRLKKKKKTKKKKEQEEETEDVTKQENKEDKKEKNKKKGYYEKNIKENEKNNGKDYGAIRESAKIWVNRMPTTGLLVILRSNASRTKKT